MPDRYARQSSLPGIGPAGQRALEQSHIFVAGTGGLGSPVLMYLACAGIGRITFVDRDVVEITNMNRQILFDSTDIGSRKTDVACRRLSAINPDIHLTPLDTPLNEQMITESDFPIDLVIDCLDNDPSRRMLARACHARGIPMVHGALAGYEATLAVFQSRTGPCYACVYPDPPVDAISPPVLGGIAGTVGSMMAVEAIRVILDVGPDRSGSLLLMDFERGTFDRVYATRITECPICGIGSGSPKI